jgi:uncharacterized membrane protein
MLTEPDQPRYLGFMASELSASRRDVKVVVALEPDDPIERLRALRAADEELANWLSQAVGEARRVGRSWAEIGDALGVTRQAAWKLYNDPLRAAIDQARAEACLTDDEAIAVANAELRAVRARRRR